MTDKPEFKREERYVVLKISKLSPISEVRTGQLKVLRNSFAHALVDCVVVEHDWPEYEPVWQMIEARVTGADPVPPVGGEPEVVGYRCRQSETEKWHMSSTPAYWEHQPVILLEDHRAHVTRLQAEVDHWKRLWGKAISAGAGLEEERDALQAKLTSAIADKNAFAQNAVDLRAEVERLGKRVEEEVATAISNELKSEREVLALQSDLQEVARQHGLMLGEVIEERDALHSKLDDEAANHVGTLAEVQRLQSELTKARELLSTHCPNISIGVREFLSNQSAPAGKPTQAEVERLKQAEHTSEPVSPAGGEPLPSRPYASEEDQSSMTDYEIGLGHGGCEMWDKFQPHVTRLQAELLRRAGAIGSLAGERSNLQAELAKARECLRDIICACGDERSHGYISMLAEDALSNQSAPADKGQGEPVAVVMPDFDTWYAKNRGVIGTEIYKNERKVWSACLDEFARLNSEQKP